MVIQDTCSQVNNVVKYYQPHWEKTEPDFTGEIGLRVANPYWTLLEKINTNI